MDLAGASAPSLRIDGVSKRYVSDKLALDEVRFQARSGEFVVLLGPSGSGKSTLIRLIAGIETLDSGEIAFDGKTVARAGKHLPPEERDLAMVFQDYALWPHMKAVENVAFALRRLKMGASERRRMALEMLDRVGLAANAEQYPNDLSGGEQQRVALARALVAKPGLLLFDEPLSNLDADLRERLRVEIASLTRECGSTAVYITHDQSEAFALADKIGVLHAGRLVQYSTPEALYTAPETPFVARFTGLAGELPGYIESWIGDDTVVVRIGDTRVTAHAGSLDRSQLGGNVHLLIRTAAASVAQATGDIDRPATNELDGTVCDVAFRGRGYDHVVEVSNGHRLVGVFGTERLDRGMQVQLVLDPTGCFAFGDADAGVATTPVVESRSLASLSSLAR
ncbi:MULTISPECIES: ABC transporter ATP-binding protein [Ferrimicrobium]|uniref:ABC transporter ATP-binding protein n=1 Tax=Ferrimicrobium TaxID=121038 RepID=UPI0023F2C0DF|nr:ABC transporter ATP-binding protein [Ferrimicrobium sp.]MCL5054306.1 ABC transporter ATP-binding protein [Gammaproteobacteria bacterium]